MVFLSKKGTNGPGMGPRETTGRQPQAESAQRQTRRPSTMRHSGVARTSASRAAGTSLAGATSTPRAGATSTPRSGTGSTGLRTSTAPR